LAVIEELGRNSVVVVFGLATQCEHLVIETGTRYCWLELFHNYEGLVLARAVIFDVEIHFFGHIN
jgi:hypothetical protein